MALLIGSLGSLKSHACDAGLIQCITYTQTFILKHPYTIGCLNATDEEARNSEPQSSLKFVEELVIDGSFALFKLTFESMRIPALPLFLWMVLFIQ